MRINDLRAAIAERDTLLGKKRLGKNQKARLATLSEIIGNVRQPLPEPERTSTGLDEHGQSAGDRQGNVYLLHCQRTPGARESRRLNKSGRFMIQPLRSRIQRTTRKRRTGGVK